jgi:hypothetical protein
MDGRSDFPVLHLPGPLPARLARKPTSTTSNGAPKLARVHQLNSIFAIFRVSDHDKALVLKSRCL